ncbi:hypothetical protein J4467_01875 [Candidatus Woesearchaeota archaeon]|nr:hypothetical protein [Candidatus Woesearchaeota archaeon]
MQKKKNTTWRLFDDKNLTKEDIFILINKNTLKEFAIGKIISIRMRTFGKLTKKDWKGHEKFSSENAMYTTYSGYYKQKVTKDTQVKVIKFKIEKII